MSIAEDYHKDAVTITPKGTLDADGTYDVDGTPVVTTGRVKEVTGMRQDRNGAEYQFKYIVWLAPDETVALEDTITFGGTAYEVRDITKQDDLLGTGVYIKCYCG